MCVQLVKNESNETNYIRLGEKIAITNDNKIELRGNTIRHIKGVLKSPSTAEFEEEFKYVCEEENIIRVEGYVDSQNSFGAVIRANFICEYFAVDTTIDTLVYLMFDNTELIDNKDTTIKQYKKQARLDNINQQGNEFNQEKLDYIIDDFNSDEINDVGRILEGHYDEKETSINLKVIAESSRNDKKNKEYWTNFNICSILHYFNEFDIKGIVKINVFDINDNKTAELVFDDNFIKEKWKDNSQIDLVRELFGDRYKDI